MDNKALGKGLSALISSAVDKVKMDNALDQISKKDQEQNNPKDETPAESFISYLSPKAIANNPFQPRENYDESDLEELKASIKEKGILQPIVVRPAVDLVTGTMFQVVAGERRLRAARALGLEKVPIFVKDVSDGETLLLALIENIQRQDLNVIEEARAFERLVNDFKLSQDQIAVAVGKNRTTVSNTLRLLKLPKDIQQHLIDNRLSMGHARALLALDNETAQLKMAQDIINQELSVRSVEGLVKQVSKKTPNKTKLLKEKDADIAQLEDELRQILGTKVTIEDKKGRGKLIVEYYSLDDLDRVLDILRRK